ncbi:MAG: SUMF1/EgtB/PvdO family nonheme iron enzyme [Polyangiaceae bacterium]|nr:SUMF1/EgtB/PvdO family nonheme iron enzyme [Polyangiaceae bacterium]
MARTWRWRLGVVVAVVGLGAGSEVLAEREKPRKPGPPAPAPPGPPAPQAGSEWGAMVAIPGGKFKMGSEDGDPDERPAHEEEVKGFKLDETEVTVGAYARCVKEGKCTTPVTGGRCNWVGGREKHPVNCVNWEQAKAFCEAAGKRLPTEVEWEYAARGGAEGRKYSWGSEEPGARACWDGEGNDEGAGKRRGTCEVGKYAAGAYGLRDMGGNVWEWTADVYCPYRKEGGQDTACKYDAKARVYRGGGWNNVNPVSLRGALRVRGEPSGRDGDLGFRCAG